jgi:signal transduction histidine kinase
MAAMGRMAAGLAHEINTPLAYVRATMAVLKEMLIDNGAIQLASAEEMGELFTDGLYGIDQISELVLTLKNFTRLDQARIGEFSVEEGLDSSLLLARYTIKHIAQVRKTYGNVHRISCSPAQINQVFLNIIVNAAHAMECRQGKGLLDIQTSEEDGFVKVQIRDNGTGIPSHVLPKIFDPFFTTKKIGEGSGTGLALAYRIVESHGGKIKVDTEEKVGTTFTVLLPIESAAETQAALKAQPQPA